MIISYVMPTVRVFGCTYMAHASFKNYLSLSSLQWRPIHLYLMGREEGEGEEGGEPKNEALLFQSTVDIHFQNAHKPLFQSTVDIYFQNAHKTQKTAKASTLCVYLKERGPQCQCSYCLSVCHELDAVMNRLTTPIFNYVCVTPPLPLPPLTSLLFCYSILGANLLLSYFAVLFRGRICPLFFRCSILGLNYSVFSLAACFSPYNFYYASHLGSGAVVIEYISQVISARAASIFYTNNSLLSELRRHFLIWRTRNESWCILSARLYKSQSRKLTFG